MANANVQVAIEKSKVEELQRQCHLLEVSLEGARAEAQNATLECSLAKKDVECAQDKVKFFEKMLEDKK